MKRVSCAAVSGLDCGFSDHDEDEGELRRRFWAHVERTHADLAAGMGERRNQEWQHRLDGVLRDDAPSTRGGLPRPPGQTPPTRTPPPPAGRGPDDPASTPKSLRRTR